MATYFVKINCPQKAQYVKRNNMLDSQKSSVSKNCFVDRCFPPGSPKGANHTTTINSEPIANFFSTIFKGGRLISNRHLSSLQSLLIFYVKIRIHCNNYFPQPWNSNCNLDVNVLVLTNYSLPQTTIVCNSSPILLHGKLWPNKIATDKKWITGNL